MRRREFTGLIGVTLSWPLPLAAQQATIPVVGLLSSVPFETRRDQLAAFRQGLKAGGFVEGQSIQIEYRWAENQSGRLPILASELVKIGVAVITTIGGDAPILAAKAATATVPVVFVTGGDAVTSGFVASLSRPGGNLTGVSFLPNLLVSKRLQVLGELTSARLVGVLVNSTNPNAQTMKRDAQEAAETLGLKLVVLEAAVEREIDQVFATFSRENVDAISVESDPFFLARQSQIVALAAQVRLPAIYPFREFAEAGGLLSYGASLADAYREA